MCFLRVSGIFRPFHDKLHEKYFNSYQHLCHATCQLPWQLPWQPLPLKLTYVNNSLYSPIFYGSNFFCGSSLCWCNAASVYVVQMAALLVAVFILSSSWHLHLCYLHYSVMNVTSMACHENPLLFYLHDDLLLCYLHDNPLLCTSMITSFYATSMITPFYCTSMITPFYCISMITPLILPPW